MKPPLPSTVLAILLPALMPLATARADQVDWRSEYGPALAEARQKDRPLLLYLARRDCPECDRLERGPFREPVVVELLNRRFVPLKLAGEQNTVLSRHLGIQ